MASNYDITFLRLLMQHQLADKPQAMRCVQVIDEQAQQGRQVTALDVVVRMGMLDPNRARELDALTREELRKGGPAPTGSFARPGAPAGPAPTGPAPTGAFARPGAPTGPGGPAPTGAHQRPGAPAGQPPSGSHPRPGGPPPGPGDSRRVPRPGGPAPAGPGDSRRVPAPAGAPAAPPPRPAPAPSGEGGWQELGPELPGFECGPKLERGPAGTSYEGRKRGDPTPYVVKVLTRRFDAHPELLRQVQAELQAWIGFRHPNVAATVAAGNSSGRQMVVFERARGRPLSAWLAERGPFPPTAALKIVQEVALALAAGKARTGRSCGDVRAEKVFYDGQHAQLVDLGLSRAACLAAGFGQFGLPFGHPAALAPEVVQEDQQEPTDPADVYALGILFYQLLCGVLPFQGSPEEQLSKHFESPPPPPPKEVSFSTKIAGLILRMTAKSPSQRLASPELVATVIGQLLEGKPVTLPPPAAGRPVGREEWSQVSDKAGAAQPAEDWSVSKIMRAPQVGPTDLEATRNEMRAVTDRLPREVLATGEVQVGEKLGRGRVGTTYEGTLGGLPVVVKVLSRKFAEHPEMLQRIMSGARASQALRHPNTVAVLQVKSVGERDLIVYEKVPGGRTLRQILQERSRLLPSQATARVTELAKALEAAERAGLAHGDIRPEKVLIDEQGRARLTDFGLAEAACLAAGFGKSGLPFGHPDYLAPEVVQERRSRPESRGDIYALGMLYYELICGRPPFRSQEVREALRKHLEAKIPPPPDDVTMPSAVAELIVRMTAKDPSRRIGSAAKLLPELERCAGLDASGVGAVEVEEFDPSALGAEDPVSSEGWAATSETMAKRSGEWDKEKLVRARKAAPKGFDGTASDDSDALAAAIKQAVTDGPRATSSRRMKVGRGGGDYVKGSRPGVGKGAFVKAVGGIAATLLVMVVIHQLQPPPKSLTDDELAALKKPKGPPAPALELAPPPDLEAIAAENKKINASLDDYESKVRARLREGDFQGALQLGKRLPEELRESQVGKPRLALLQQEILRTYALRRNQEQDAFVALLANEETAAAEALLRGMKSWLLEGDGLVKELQEEMEDQRRKRNQSLVRLQGAQGVNVGLLEQKLRSKLKGNLLVYENGAVVLGYPDASDALAQDLQTLLGDKPAKAAIPRLEDPAVLLRAAKAERPLLVAIPVSFSQPVDVTLEFMLGSVDKKAVELGVMLGLDTRGSRGAGLTWDLRPLELERRRGVQVAPRSKEPLDVPSLTPLRLRLTIDPGARPEIALELRNLAAKRIVTEGRRAIPLASPEGMVGLFVSRAEVYVTGFEVRGLADPKITR